MVIVGAGDCGVRAAVALRDLGHVGPITLAGAERHHPYERPPLSKTTLDNSADPLPKYIVTPERLATADIRLCTSVTAEAIDRTRKLLRLDDGSVLAYRKLLLATGARPRPLPMAVGLARCVTLRTFDDALALRAHLRPGRRLAVVGGGFIGLELAAMAREAGVDVTVIEALPRILQRGVPPAIAAAIHARHMAAGVVIRCGHAITSMVENETGLHITLADGDMLMADIAVIGIGALPNTALAEAAGLTIDNGIAVDDCLTTSDPDILAAGDCCSFPLALYGGRRVRLESWRNAQEQGALAAGTMMGQHDAHRAVPWFWSDQYELGLQIAGLADEAVDVVRRDLGPDAFLLFHLAADGRLLAASGLGPGNTVARDIRLAEMLIARRAHPPRDALADPGVKLKSLVVAESPAARHLEGVVT
ncbi:NAD(P)/FAD-dependent oxidoreductase [Lichenihabitans psoromatis]|uniref:NAD(P)/FAD-dependent oxidoreductase n=1 Tax=Lichenihabitans psoromatis TaxID=2528642 RepID=UPI001035D517|nr:FAD-dependent oxidoreductase [Lichenihabitans psoromatis]